MSRTENSIRNIKFAIAFQTLTILASFFTRKIFVLVLSKEYLGLDGTFSSVLTLLSLTELGIGAAITYSLYQPLAEEDRKQIVSLMNLYKKAYRIISIVIIILGICFIPFLTRLIKDIPNIPHIYNIYLFFVLNTAVSYLYVYKQSLIIADQKQYIVSIYHYSLKFLMYLFQAGLIWITHNYFLYLGVQLVSTIIENVMIFYLADKMYPYLKTLKPASLPLDTKKTIIKNTTAMLAHKIGSIIVNGTDNLLISYFAGIIYVGLYSNYLMIINGLTSVYQLLYKSITASIGNLGATEKNSRNVIDVFYRLNFITGWLYGFSMVCLIVLFNPFIEIWIGKEYLFPQYIVIIIAVNFYVSGMRKSVLTFREAYGLYWYDRYKPMIEALLNFVLSIILANKLGITGILVGTFISTISVPFWVEPYVLFKYAFETSVFEYFVRYIKTTFIVIIETIFTCLCVNFLSGNAIALFLKKCLCCILIPNILYFYIYRKSDDVKYFFELIKNQWNKIAIKK
ncbi:MAG: hypothetical protein HFG51_14045 [Lachnospiraceae bacterium]|nr:hypothetical protein [Lachnospiraceae bacterium]